MIASLLDVSPKSVALDVAGVVSLVLLLAGTIRMVVRRSPFSGGAAVNCGLLMVVGGTILILNGLVKVFDGIGLDLPCFGVILLLLGNGLVVFFGGVAKMFNP